MSWQSLAWFSWKILFSQFQFSTQAHWSLWAWSALRLAWCSWNRWESNSWLISWKAKSECLFSPFSPQSLPQLDTIFAEPHSLLELQVNFPCLWSQRFLWWRCGRRTAPRNDRQPWNDERHKIVCLADSTFPIFGQSWLMTADPLIGVSVIFAKLAQR